MQEKVSLPRKIFHFFLDIVETIVVALSFFVIIYLFLVQPHQVNGNSMWPSFYDGEYLLTDKFSYRINDPERGDVIIFHAPSGANCPKQLQCDFVKRIIGLPNEEIEIKQGKLFINGSAITEYYLPEKETILAQQKITDEFHLNLSEEEYFVMGDNRSHSSDSRAWGPVPKKNIVGKAWIRYWPPQRIGFIAEASY